MGPGSNCQAPGKGIAAGVYLLLLTFESSRSISR